MHPAIISGQASGVEYAFGGKEHWANYLRALHFTNTYHGPITPDFIQGIYTRLLGGEDEPIRSLDPASGRMGIGSNAGRPYPMPCSDGQVGAINANPYLEWLPVTMPEGNVDVSGLAAVHPLAPHMWSNMGWLITEEPTGRGFINYVYKTQEAKLREIAGICDWYNYVAEHNSDPEVLSALLQRKIVSLHAGVDCNGTTSRLLMNWSLQKAGLGPSIPYPDDLVTTEGQHIEYVRSGRVRYEQYHKRVEAGETDPVKILGLEEDYERFQRSGATPPPLEPGAIHERGVFDAFLSSLGSGAVLGASRADI